MSIPTEALLAWIQEPILTKMLALWDEKRAGRDWPLRRDFDPLEFAFALGHISLVEVHAPKRFFYRLDGTKQSELFGADCTGKYLDQVNTRAARDLTEQDLYAALASGRPEYHERDLDGVGGPRRCRGIVLPLSQDGRGIDILMTVVVADPMA
jgi:hypothetical protein